ncbi:uncharacterized protein PFLUO_LOCUS8017 [Penicillium psychrofluorescens]|uniref:uncharacterized protein n=1 Tax=Penicillium psychrofluorescens TaxID=3158075 RepID=UPI003CCE209C
MARIGVRLRGTYKKYTINATHLLHTHHKNGKGGPGPNILREDIQELAFHNSADDEHSQSNGPGFYRGSEAEYKDPDADALGPTESIRNMASEKRRKSCGDQDRRDDEAMDRGVLAPSK